MPHDVRGGSGAQRFSVRKGRLRAAVETLEGRVLLSAANTSPLLTDINALPNDSQPTPIAQVGNDLVFMATVPGAPQLTVRIPWITDGTAGGTHAMVDLSHGSFSPDPYGFTGVKGHIIFFARQYDYNRQIYVAHLFGTNLSGADAVELLPGLTPSANFASDDPPVVINGKAYFTATVGTDTTRSGIYVTDGTSAGTRLAIPGSPVPPFLAAFNGSLVYLNNQALWRLNSDGSQTQIAVSSAAILFNGSLYYVSNQILWRLTTNGTQTQISLPSAVAAGPLSIRGGYLNFVSDGHPWRTDGTPAGTGPGPNTFPRSPQLLPNGQILSVNNGIQVLSPDGSTALLHAVNFASDGSLMNLVVVGNHAYFNDFVYAGTPGKVSPAIWVTDGTRAGTSVLKIIGPPTDGRGYLLRNLTAFGNKVIFGADDGVTGPELWITDGTPNGTTLLKDINPGSAGSAPAPGYTGPDGYINALTQATGPFMVVNGQAYFAATDGGDPGVELWCTDGTPSGTVMVDDVWPSDAVAANQRGVFPIPQNGVTFNGKTYFVASDGVTIANNVWMSDGTAAGTQPIFNIAAAPYASLGAGDLTVFNNSLYFVSGIGSNQATIYQSDGTASGTHSLGDSIEGLTGPQPLIPFQGNLWFINSFRDFTHVPTGGFVYPSGSSLSYDPENLTVSGNYIYFTEPFDAQHWNLCRFDGNDWSVVVPNCDPYALTDLNGKLFFGCTPSGAGAKQLWVVDGGGPHQVAGVDDPIGIAALGNYVYVSSGAGSALYRTDGTPGGTSSVGASLPAPPTLIRSAGGRLWMFAGAPNATLWTSDGTAVGTISLGSIYYVPTNGTGAEDLQHDPYFFQGPDGATYFQATAPATGTELYRSDGTVARTTLLADFMPGPADSLPGPFIVAGGRFFVAARDPENGREWHFVPQALASVAGTIFGDTDGNGLRDAGEVAIPQVDVYLDANGNGSPDAGEMTALTDSAGRYQFTGVEPGNYSIRVALLSGWVQTDAYANLSVTIGAASNLSDVDLGLTSPPTPIIDGPDSVTEGGQITLDASASIKAGGAISKFEWDTNYNGTTFVTRASGSQLVFSAANIDGPATRTIALRVTDTDSVTAIATTVINIINAIPTAKISAGAAVTVGTTGTVSFAGAADPSPADVLAGFKYSFDFNNDGVFDVIDSASSSASVPASFLATAGTHVIVGRIKDKDGGFTDFTAAIQSNYAMRTVYVDAASTATSPDGSSWQKAYKTLDLGLAAIANGGRLLIAGGTYKPAAPATTFQLTSGQELDGGYAGAANAASPNSRNIAVYSTNIGAQLTTANSNGVLTLDGLALLAGLSFPGGTLVVRNCTFTQTNQAIYVPGAASVSISDCTFTGNSGGGSYAGAAITCYGSVLLNLAGCTFTRNASSIYTFDVYGGAIVSAVQCTSGSTIRDCSFDGNSSYGLGVLAVAAVAVIDCTFVGNVSAAFVQNSTPLAGATFTNCTFSANTGTPIRCGPSWGYAAVTNSILWNNADNANQPSPIVSYTYDDTASPAAGAGNVSVDPRFVRNPSAGPDGKWGTADDDYGDLHLQKTSPLIDAGNNAALPAGLTTDLAGNPRFTDVVSTVDSGHGVAPIVDIGPFEVPGPVAKPGGPYSVAEGGSLMLSASGSSDASGTIVKYEWDTNYNGTTFVARATGVQVTFSAAGLDGPSTHAIALRVTDGNGLVAIVLGTIAITNARPTATFAAGPAVTPGSTGTVSFSAATDPSPADVAAGFNYSYDFDNNGTFEIVNNTSPSATVPASYLTAVGAHTIHGRVIDKDGGFTDYTTALQTTATTQASISGTIYNDANANGLRDNSEAVIAGQKLYIDKNLNGVLDTGEPTFTTGASGVFTFSGLTAGTYRIRAVATTGWRWTNPTSGYYSVTVTAGQTVTGKSFGRTTAALISGVVFKDSNANAKQDTGELGLAGWVVYLDTNNNGTLDAGEKSFTTGADGKFSFIIPAGTYHLREVLKTGFTRTTPLTGVFTLTLSSGQSLSGKNFGDK